MTLASQILGWVLWSFVAVLALSFAHGWRVQARAGQPTTFMTGLQTLLLSVVAFVFLVSPVSKLHIFWVLPLVFFRPFLFYLQYAPLSLLVVWLFVRFLTLGVRSPIAKDGLLLPPPRGGLSTPLSVLLKAEWMKIRSLFSRQ